MKDFTALRLNRGYTVLRDGESALHLFWDTEDNGNRIFDICCAYLPLNSDGILDGKIAEQIETKMSFKQGVGHLVKVKNMLKEVVRHLVDTGVEFKMGITPTDERRESAYRSLLKSGWINSYGTYWLAEPAEFIR